MSKITDIYLVDTENVGVDSPDWDYLGSTCIIYYFVTSLSINLDISDKVRVVPVLTCGKHDALDFILDSKLGFLMCHYGKNVKYHIVSQDTGFDVICINWAGMGYNIKRHDLLNDTRVESDFDSAIRNLQVKHNKKYRALNNSYNSWLNSKAHSNEVLRKQVSRCLNGVVSSDDILIISDNYYLRYLNTVQRV